LSLWTSPPMSWRTTSTTTRANSSFRARRSTDDGPLRTTQTRLQPDRRSPGLAVRVPGFFQDALPDRDRPCRRGIRVRQEPLGAAVRDGCDDDGVAPHRRGRRRDTGRLDIGAEEIGRSFGTGPLIDSVGGGALLAR